MQTNLKKLTRACLLLAFLANYAPAVGQDQAADWQSLFNGQDLSGWDTYLGAPPTETEEASADAPPLGLNHDPSKVFGVAEVDGEPALKISGEIGGGISTVEEYQNYHLTLQFKWGENMPWASRDKRDSGLLYHAVGPHGADGGFWMRSQEFQIQEGDCGDYWGVAGGSFDIPAMRQPDSTLVFNPTGSIYAFSEKSENGRHCIKQPDAEKPTGEWNTVELYCHGDTSVHVINSVAVMVLYRSRQVENGKETALTRGKIQIQSEGAEVYYRNIQIRSLNRIPTGLLSTRSTSRNSISH